MSEGEQHLQDESYLESEEKRFPDAFGAFRTDLAHMLQPGRKWFAINERNKFQGAFLSRQNWLEEGGSSEEIAEWTQELSDLERAIGAIKQVVPDIDYRVILYKFGDPRASLDEQVTEEAVKKYLPQPDNSE